MLRTEEKHHVVASAESQTLAPDYVVGLNLQQDLEHYHCTQGEWLSLEPQMTMDTYICGTFGSINVSGVPDRS